MEYYDAWNLAEQQQEAAQQEQNVFLKAWEMAEKEQKIKEEEMYNCWERAERWVKKNEKTREKHAC